MRKTILLVSLLSILLIHSSSAFADERQDSRAGMQPGSDLLALRTDARVCARTDSTSTVSCDIHVLQNNDGSPFTTSNYISGYTPAQLHAAYGAATGASQKQIIAIVDAYDNPNVQSDLATYSSALGIPGLAACSGAISATAQPCFKKIDQSGGGNYPAGNTSWGLEIDLDVQAAHAMCQNCSILLVEAKSTSYNDLLAAVDTAVAQGATIVSNSYGSSEFSGQSYYDPHFNRQGVAFLFSSGDSGYGVQYPASSPYVTAVGGTHLTMSGTTYQGESAWSGAGSGCSAYSSKPSFQTDSNCAHRTVADVSADADPQSGIAIYDSYGYNGVTGWFTAGGTSLAAPIIAGVYALAGGVPSNVMGNSMVYNGAIGLRDVTSGANGSCSLSYLCTALSGYDGPTGLGTPKLSGGTQSTGSSGSSPTSGSGTGSGTSGTSSTGTTGTTGGTGSGSTGSTGGSDRYHRRTDWSRW